MYSNEPPCLAQETASQFSPLLPLPWPRHCQWQLSPWFALVSTIAGDTKVMASHILYQCSPMSLDVAQHILQELASVVVVQCIVGQAALFTISD